MRHVIGLLWAVNFAVVAIALLYFKKAGTGPFVVLLAAGLVGGYFIHRADLWIKKVGITHTADGYSLGVEAAQNQIEAAKNEALDELNKRVAVHEEALAGVIDKANKTREALEKVAEEAAPPTLSLRSQPSVRKTAGAGYQLLLEFEPSKNVPFGRVSFAADILQGEKAIIQQLSSVITSFDRKSTKSDDGKRAETQYVPAQPQGQRLVLNVSAPCRVRISGSHMAEPLEFDIE